MSLLVKGSSKIVSCVVVIIEKFCGEGKCLVRGQEVLVKMEKLQVSFHDFNIF